MAKFALLGDGYIAQRHKSAIKDLGHELIACYDFKDNHPIQSEQEFFAICKNEKVDYISICSPSFCHANQILDSLKIDCNVIVEKPICLSTRELMHIQDIEKSLERKAYSIFQLRYHPKVEQIQSFIQSQNSIQIIYEGKRDSIYFQSWKGDKNKSGGIVAAVGIHYFDLLTLYFGNFKADTLIVERNNLKESKGEFQLKNAQVKWYFKFYDQEEHVELKRQFLINDTQVDLSSYASNLHTINYSEILKGNGVDTAEALKSLQIVECINAIDC